GFKENLHAIFCLAENSVGPLATRPDDVITLYSGKTVEVNNTDAEGRLVLGDGVAYAKKDLQATTIVDMATLTGAQGVATGRYHAALLTNNEDYERKAVSAGKLSGDLIHPMPFVPELHFCEFNSSHADMKNSVSDNACGAVSCAGLFIGSHIGFDYEGKWLHIDMAKPCYQVRLF
ncbi:putative aminopeptidase NPEPL1, partial [Araneus ventricosus]